MTISVATCKLASDFSDANLWQDLPCCPLCGCASFSTVRYAKDPHYGNPGLFAIARCKGCTVEFLNPMPTAVYLSTAYPSDYYSFGAAFPNSRKAQVIKTIKKILRTVLYYHASITGDPKFRSTGTMLDIGCGAGSFLAEMRAKGWKVHGVEPNFSAAERGRLEGIDIFAGTVESANYPPAHFDYVRSNHSFEHIENPREVLREIRRIIKPTGLLFIGVPNVAGLMARLFGKYWWYLGAPVHTFGYNPISLERLLTQEGFKVERIRYNSTFAGIFGSLQIYLNRKRGKPSESGWVINNPALMLLGQWTARLIDFLGQGDCIEVIATPA